MADSNLHVKMQNIHFCLEKEWKCVMIMRKMHTNVWKWVARNCFIQVNWKEEVYKENKWTLCIGHTKEDKVRYWMKCHLVLFECWKNLDGWSNIYLAFLGFYENSSLSLIIYSPSCHCKIAFIFYEMQRIQIQRILNNVLVALFLALTMNWDRSFQAPEKKQTKQKPWQLNEIK